MNILLFHPNKEVIDLLSLPLESATKSKVHGYISLDNALAALKTEYFEALILDLNDQALGKILHVAEDLKPKPVLFICQPDYASLTEKEVMGWHVQGAAKYSNLLSELIPMVKEKFPQVEVGDDSKFYPIRTDMLMKISPFELDIFIRLSPNHYVRIFSEGDEFTGDDLHRYGARKKVSHMYVRDEAGKQMIHLANEKLKALLKGKALVPAEAQIVLDETVDFMQGLIRGVGVTPEVEELVKNSVDLTLKSMGDFPELGKILAQMAKEKDRYISRHSTLLAHIACAIAVGMEWYSDITFRKLTFAAYLHDASLSNDELCKVKSIQEFTSKYPGKFNSEEMEEFKKHPANSALIIQQFKDLPAEIDKIVFMHHEHPGGIGFPSALAYSNIGPLPTLFIIAHDLVDYFLESEGKFDVSSFLRENEKKFGQGNFKKVARCLASFKFS